MLLLNLPSSTEIKVKYRFKNRIPHGFTSKTFIKFSFKLVKILF